MKNMDTITMSIKNMEDNNNSNACALRKKTWKKSTNASLMWRKNTNATTIKKVKHNIVVQE
jgi:hypothetical protein